MSQGISPGRTTRWLAHLGLDRSVSLGVATRAWTVLSGPVTLLLIASRFSPAEQGYYYTFTSLMGLQAFLELGLGTVIVQFAAHEWAHLRLDERGRVSGVDASLSRLASLLRFSVKWYAWASAAAMIGLTTAGYYFLAKSPSAGAVPTSQWVPAWITLCVLSAFQLCMLPVWSVLEGCNEVERVYLYRFVSGVASTFGTWAVIALGGGLWAAPIGVFALAVVGIVFLIHYFRGFVSSLVSVPVREVIHWREEILPLQWRIATSWISGYFVFQVFTPLAFRFYGPVVAGRVGMTWALVSAVAATAWTWTSSKIPSMGVLTARRDYTELDRLFWRAFVLSLGAYALGAAGVLGGIFTLGALQIHLAERLLPLGPSALFLLGSALGVMTWNVSAYARAHKQEPFVSISVAGAVITAVSSYVLGRSYGVTGMASAYVMAWTIQAVFFARRFGQLRTVWRSASVDLQYAAESS